eukprot:6019426-Prymnesium_polylepis.3
MAEEEALIQAVTNLRLEGGAAFSVAELHAALEKNGVVATAGEVKKAASKAAKRAPKAAPAAAPTVAVEPATNSKAASKASKLFDQKMKAAESAMMEEQKRLRDRWLSGDGVAGNVAPREGKAFIQWATGRALAGALDPDEELCKEV